MTSRCRMRIIAAGFSVYRMEGNTRIITRCTENGGWSRVGKYTTLKEVQRAFADIMRGPKAISD